MPELLPCPFCGAIDEVEPDDVYGEDAAGNESRASGCERCGASGPMMPTVEEAVEAWNTRTPEAL